MRDGGRPLPDIERTFFEDRTGADLGGVRVHTDGAAAETARDLNARAYTVGSDIAFGAGDLFDRLQPGTTIDIAVEPQINEFNGRVSVELEVKDLQFA